MSASMSVAVIGAGVSGLACARALRQAAAEVTVFDKARGPGGRLSTRRTEVPALGPAPLRFDHGAPHFGVRDPAFGVLAEEWVSKGLLAEREAVRATVREGALHPTGERFTRFVGVPTMSALCRSLAKGLAVRSGCRVTEVARTGDRWVLALESGERTDAFDAVAVTAPAPQAAVLLAAAPELAARAERARFTGCRVVMAAFSERVALDADAVELDGSPLAWISRESAKPGRPAAEAWVLQASPEWSDAHADLEPAVATERLLASWRRFAPAPEPVHATGHRWLYARVQADVGGPCLFDPAAGIGAAGDWCAGGGVEGAFRSGVTLARRIRAPQ